MKRTRRSYRIHFRYHPRVHLFSGDLTTCSSPRSPSAPWFWRVWCSRLARRPTRKGPVASRSATGRRCVARRATASRRETGLLEKWALNGENFLWRAPYGGRSAPIVMGNRVYVQNPSGRGADLQERVMALDADTGKVVWEYKFNLFQSDVPPHRVGWASPAADPETGNIYALSGGAQVDRAQPRRQAAVAAVDRRGVRGLHDARRPHDVADRRRRPGDRQRGRLELGRARRPRAPVHRARQAHRRDRLRLEPRRPAVRHGLRRAAHRHDQRHCGCSSPASATAPSTPSSRRPARRSGASSPPSAPSTPASS